MNNNMDEKESSNKIILNSTDIINIIHENNIYKKSIEYLQNQIEELSYENYNLQKLKAIQEGYIFLKVSIPKGVGPGKMLKGKYNNSIYRFVVPNDIKENKFFYVKLFNPEKIENNNDLEWYINEKNSFTIDNITNINKECIDNSNNINTEHTSHSVDDKNDIDIDFCFNNGRCFF